MFPNTTERTKTAVDQVGRTARQMAYFLSFVPCGDGMPFEQPKTRYHGKTQRGYG